MIRMKALKSFRGRPDEGDAGRVKAGREFNAADERRANELENPPHKIRLAVRVQRVGEESTQLASAEVKVERAAGDQVSIDDRAAAAKLIEKNTPGPLFPTGGETGAATSPSSSQPAPQRNRRGSRKPEAAPKS